MLDDESSPYPLRGMEYTSCSIAPALLMGFVMAGAMIVKAVWNRLVRG